MRNGGTRVFGRADYSEKFKQVKIKRKINRDCLTFLILFLDLWGVIYDDFTNMNIQSDKFALRFNKP